jgi:hypothetical protein
MFVVRARTYAVAMAVLFPAIVLAADGHPVEAQLRREFPSLALDSTATFTPSASMTRGRMISALRPHLEVTARALHASDAWTLENSRTNIARKHAVDVRPDDQSIEHDGGNPFRVHYPRRYDDPIVVELGNQRIVLRAIGATPAIAQEAQGKLVYEKPYRDTDVVEIPRDAGSAELLILRSARAPLTFEFEIVESEGIVAIVADAGGLRFVPHPGPVVGPAEQAGGRFTRPAAALQIDPPWVIDATGRWHRSAQWELEGESPMPSRIRLKVSTTGLGWPVVVDSSFSTAGNLATARQLHTAALLPNGKVLLAGGQGSSGYLSSAEIYDPADGTFRSTGSLVTARAWHTATLLPSGKVLLAGGQGSSGYLSSAEIYDPANGTFSPTGALAMARHRHTATLLANGKVLVAGGYGSSGYLSSAQIYDPANGTFSSTGALATARYQQTATLLYDGKVLLAGGSGELGYLSSAEVYNPASGTFSSTGSLASARHLHAATLLPDGAADTMRGGKVLLFGGYGPSGTVSTAELYDPVSGTFSSTGSLVTARYLHTATLLPNGTVLLAGGIGDGVNLSSAEIYDPAIGTFSSTGSLATSRVFHTAILLPNGEVMIAGGAGPGGGALSVAEFYDTSNSTFSHTDDLATARHSHTGTLLESEMVLIAGGWNTGIPGWSLSSAELYLPSRHIMLTTGSLITARQRHTATLLPNGKVLLAAGVGPSGALSSAELYDPASGTFSSTGSLANVRDAHTATLLPNGKVLVTGGSDSSGGYLRSAEIYDPASGTFSSTGDLANARRSHTATLLPSGKVLVIGGKDNSEMHRSAELYDPVNGTFSSAGDLVYRRSSHTATWLPSGSLLIVGGEDTTVRSAELYDPASSTFAPTGALATARFLHTATLLPTGMVLIAGGFNRASLGSAELYDPARGTFSSAGDLAVARRSHTATLLQNGKVLLPGGMQSPTFLASAELYDAGLDFEDSWRPEIRSFVSHLYQPGTMALTGTLFRGSSEGSSGGTSSSPTNAPLLQLQRVDNEQVWFVAPASWTDTSFTSTVLSGLPNGHYRVSIITNAIPSIQRLVMIGYPAPSITSVTPSNGPTNGGESVTITGANLGNLWNVTFGATTGSVTSAAAGSITVTTPASNEGLVAVAVNTAGGTATSSYTYVFNAPVSVAATATTANSVQVTWPSVFSAIAYDVSRSVDGTNYTVISTTTGTMVVDSGVVPNKSYLYKVRARSSSTTTAYTPPDLATTLIFTDPSLGGVVVKAVHFSELRTAVNAVRTLAGLQPGTWTDATLTSGLTRVKAAHLSELRSALDNARSTLSLPAVIYSNPVITPGSTVIRAQHLMDLRGGVR